MKFKKVIFLFVFISVGASQPAWSAYLKDFYQRSNVSVSGDDENGTSPADGDKDAGMFAKLGEAFARWNPFGSSPSPLQQKLQELKKSLEVLKGNLKNLKEKLTELRAKMRAKQAVQKWRHYVQEQKAFLQRKAQVQVIPLTLSATALAKKVENKIDRYYPTKATIEKIIEKHWPDFGEVVVEKAAGSLATGAIFSVARKKHPQKDQKKVFFVKVSNIRSRQAAENLKKIQESVVGRLMIQALRTNKWYADLPILTSVERLFSYQGPDRNNYTIEMMHAARGKQVYSILIGPENTAYAKKIGDAVGKSLGAFHQACRTQGDPADPSDWLTVVHGDLHQQNMFVHVFPADPAKKMQEFTRVYFIDNETMAKSLTVPREIIRDVMYTIFMSLVNWREDINRHWNNFKAFHKGFLQGYIQSHPDNVQPDLANYLKGQLTCIAEVLIAIKNDPKILEDFDRRQGTVIEGACDSSILEKVWDTKLFSFIKKFQAIPDNQLEELKKIANGLAPVSPIRWMD